MIYYYYRGTVQVDGWIDLQYFLSGADIFGLYNLQNFGGQIFTLIDGSGDQFSNVFRIHIEQYASISIFLRTLILYKYL